MKASAQQIEAIAELAMEQFWAFVAESFPEATTGDFPPPEHVAFARAADNAVSIWVHLNVPDKPARALNCPSCKKTTIHTLHQHVDRDRCRTIWATCSICEHDRPITIDDITGGDL